MDFLSLIFMIVFGGLFVLAASPIIIYSLGKRWIINAANPYQRVITSFKQLQHPFRSYIEAFANTELAKRWINEGRLSPETSSVLFAYMDGSTRTLFTRSLARERIKSIDAFLRKTKKAKKLHMDQTDAEIKHLLNEDILQNKATKEHLQFYYYDELYESLELINTHKQQANHAIQHQIDQVISRTLYLLPYFEQHKMYELSHKFKTLITKDLPESTRLLGNIDASGRLDKETELYVVLKTILSEITQMENNIKASSDEELAKRMKIMKTKYTLQQEEE
ncbi:hypothetical protein CN918_32015 [Priestia megaterium]|nr:hypothetical protein CN918_32015 [Priestia megaterium]